MKTGIIVQESYFKINTSNIIETVLAAKYEALILDFPEGNRFFEESEYEWIKRDFEKVR